MIEWIFAVIAVEAVTEIIVTSTVFARFRNFVAKINGFFGELISCGYCMSVWVSASIAWSLPGSVVGNLYADIIIRVFVLHRVSNILHELFNRWFTRLPIVLMIQSSSVNTEEIEDNVIIGDDDGEAEA